MNEFIAKHFVCFPVQRVRGQRVKEYLHQVQDVQFKPVHEINVLRDEKLRKIISYAYRNIPFYRERFNELGIRPEQIRAIRDLNRLPVLSKRDVLQNENAL